MVEARTHIPSVPTWRLLIAGVVIISMGTGGYALIRKQGRLTSDRPALAFSRFIDYKSFLYVLETGGGPAKSLTTFEADHPAWSPDGTKIAFAGAGKGIFVMNADGTAVTKLTDFPALEPAWSPDGKQIAFIGDKRDTDPRAYPSIYVIPADGGTPARITVGKEDEGDRSPTWSPDGRIAFERYSEGQSEVFTVESDGSGLTNLTRNSGDDFDPAWSPDGTKIAIATNRELPREPYRDIGPAPTAIYVIGSDGRGARRVSPPGPSERLPNDHDPVWSPDGTKIAYVTNRDGPSPDPSTEIHMVSLDGRNDYRLTNDPAIDAHPAWNPAAPTPPTPLAAETPVKQTPRLAFVTDRDGNQEIYALNAETGESARLTDDPGADIEPAWSPDGKTIAFIRRTGAGSQLMLMRADGSDGRTLPGSPEDEGHPAWSPDGRRIAFAGEAEGARDIYVMNADGSGLQHLTAGPEDDFDPAWSPDGFWIVFARDAAVGDQAADLYIVSSRGSQPFAFATTPANEHQPAWSPDGTGIAFVEDKYGNDDIVFRQTDEFTWGSARNGGGLLLAFREYDEREPAWFPGGNHNFAYVVDDRGLPEILVTEFEPMEHGPRNLTNHVATDSMPSWGPWNGAIGTEALQCHPPRFRPRYFPWLEPDDPVPVGVGSPLTGMVGWGPGLRPGWHGDTGVALETLFHPLDLEAFWAGSPAPVRGTTGLLISRANRWDRYAELWWPEGKGRCQSYHLRIDAPGLTRDELEGELRRIADSLQEP
jgi:Tol biopolymer transport system component